VAKIIKILIIEDCDDDVLLIERALRQGGVEFTSRNIRSDHELEIALFDQNWDLILADYILPGFGALEALEILNSRSYDIPFIVVSGKIEEEIAVTAMRAGAHDFITKGNMTRLVPAITRELGEAQVRKSHRTAELARLRSEEKYRLLAESITDVFFAVDNELRCTYWNKAAENLTGISSSLAISKPVFELFSGVNRYPLEEKLVEAIKKSCSQAFPLCVNMHDSSHYLEVNIYPTETGLSVLAKDISEKKRTEELQKTRDEMEKQLADIQELSLLGQLTSGVAHEVRNPLNAISVVIEALFQEIGENQNLLQYKEHIFTHVERLKRLMQDLLELGKPIERSKIVNILIYDLIHETIDIWKSSGPHEHFNLILDFNFDLEIFIKGDPHKLQQVFMNLLENAAQHSPRGSDIQIVITKEENYCRIRTIDQGSGIKPEHQKRLFEPFFTTRRKGTGLGLAIVRHIIDVHCGTISIYNNTLSPGCTVDIQLPMVKCRELKKPKDVWIANDMIKNNIN
jgi:two-component system cell cycle sensor histidine kinase/response regulator CckA